MTPYRIGLNLAHRGCRLPRSLRRHPLAFVCTVGLCIFLAVYLLADTHDKNEQLLYESEANQARKVLVQLNHVETNLTPSQTDDVIEDDSAYFRLDQAARRKRIHDVCAEDHPPGLVNTLLSSQHNLTYCPIPRTANTFWLQVFRYLNRDFPGPLPDSPLDLDPTEVHNRPFVKSQRLLWRAANDQEKATVLSSKILLSVQDPYMRLWTTYTHAVILPELWLTVGQKIEAKRPKPPPQPVAFFLPRQKVRCGHDIKFAEFMDYALTSFERDFAPYYRQCDPCQLRPYYVIKAETAARDKTFVLKPLQLAYTVTGSDARRKALALYVTSLVSSSFKKLKAGLPRECNVTVADVAHRLWRVFLVEGIVPEMQDLPSFDGIDQSQFVEHILRRATEEQQKVASTQKRRYMTAAFRALKPEVLQKFQEVFDMDFKLFDYEPQPLDIYGS